MSVRRFLLFTALPAAVALADPGAPASSAISDDELRIKGVFESSLPGTERKHALKLTFHPRVGDLSRYDHMRIPLGFRYGLTANWEATAEIEGYFSHGLGDRPFFDDAGLLQWSLGTKYNWGTSLWPGWETATGIEYTMPLGSPPMEITDGLEHYTPFVTFAHPLESMPNLRVFWGVSADMVAATGIQGRLKDNQLGDDSLKLTGGLVWDRGNFSYTLEGSVASTRLLGDLDRDVYALQPGVIWKVPQRFTPGSRGQWLLGVGLRSSYGPDGFDYGGSAKLRVNFDFKRWWRRVTRSEK
ncbi:MAG TPA: hypothetical protein VGD88_11665 [Opitutaceae bacterium]